MKTIEEAFPELTTPEDYHYFSGNYENLLESAGPTILASTHVGSYQGTLYMLLEENGTYGYLNTYYGSCSGCDSLQAAGGNIKALAELRQRLLDEVVWYKTKAEVLAAIEQDVTVSDDWYRDDDKKFLTAATKALN